MSQHDYLLFDGGKASIAEIRAANSYHHIHLPSVSAISVVNHSLEGCTEEVTLIMDGVQLTFILNCDVYDELLEAWLFCRGDNRPSTKWSKQ